MEDSFNARFTQSDIRFEIDKLFKEHNITIPFSTTRSSLIQTIIKYKLCQKILVIEDEAAIRRVLIKNIIRGKRKLSSGGSRRRISGDREGLK